MLSREDNELLTRVGPGTPMGETLRQYWIPALLVAELPERDGPAVRVRLLGEDLIAFRDSGGRIGMLGDHCPHRGASLFFGRNEEGGLRCVYHGWKYDVDGRCTDMPNEPQPLAGHEASADAEGPATPMGAAPRRFKDKIRHRAYPCREAGGIIWTYMGARTEPPPLPELEFMPLPESQIMLQKRVQYCNWVQALEGDIDQSHVGFLHSRVPDHAPFTPEEAATYESMERFYKRIDRRPHYSVVDTEYGVMGCATRTAGGDAAYYRVTHFLMPFHTITPPGAEGDPSRSIRSWVPMDDNNVMIFGVSYHPSRPFVEREYERLRTGSGANWVGTDHFQEPTTGPYGRWRPRASRENDYFRDPELQRTGPYTGISEFWAQDGAVQESMGTIYERSTEHLGTSDMFIIRTRRRLVEAAKAVRDGGIVPPAVDEPMAYRIRSAQVVSPSDVPWIEATRELLQVRPGINPGGAALGLLRQV